VIDGLGHVRALVAPNGAITEVWHYDSWGNPISPPAERIDQPFLWNGAYGYEYIPFTGLYHVGAREYDPRTARWLQRDPIGIAAGHPNVYLYCFNSPLIWKDPSGLEFVVFVHGTLSSPSVFDKSYIGAVKRTLGATAGHHLFDWSGGIETYHPSTICAAGRRLAQKLKEIREKFPHEPIYIVAHSNGGNVAIAAAQAGGPVDAIIRLGSPYYIRAGLIDVPEGVRVIDFYDRNDSVQFGSANEFGGAALLSQIPKDWSSRKEWQGWCRFEISVEQITGQAPLKGYEIHSLMRSLDVWNAISGIILSNLP
jgi:RHS repeat-associated protein